MKIDSKYMEKYGIKDSERIDLRKSNIIIGENGAGKTRILKGIKDDLHDQNKKILYLYFSEMKPNVYDNIYITEEAVNRQLTRLYEIYLLDKGIDVPNFISYIEEQGFSFLKDVFKNLHELIEYSNSYIKDTLKTAIESLNEILPSLIGRHLNYNPENEQVMISKDTESEIELKEDMKRMSPGELSLFYVSLFLTFLRHYSTDTRVILLLDEPELHLHPKALIKFVKYLKEESTVEMFCIATHSIFLVPMFDFREIIYVRNGSVQKYNSNLYNNIYNEIVGKDPVLADFIISRDMWKYYQFVAECFYQPNIVDKVNTKDEQFLKFINFIKDICKMQKEVLVLDYGAGEGRLGKTIESMGEVENDLKRKIIYYFFDAYREKPSDLHCVSFNSTEEMEGHKFHCIVLMNVLHEIDIRKWKNTFSDIYNLLEQNGFLLLCEVKALLHGEQPFSESGFLLLGQNQLKILLSRDRINTITLNEKDKTNLFIIPRNYLRAITDETIKSALISLKKELYDELYTIYIEKVKTAHTDQKIDTQIVKNYGFKTQHYLNVIFAIKLLSEKNKNDT